MTSLVIVAYRGIVLPEAATMFEEARAPKNYGAAAAAEYVAKAQAEQLADSATLPYVGQLTEVLLIDPIKKRLGRFPAPSPKRVVTRKKKLQTDGSLLGDEDDAPAPRPIALQAADWIMEGYSDAFSTDIFEYSPTKVSFIGYDPRRFIKMLGTECALLGKPMPPSFWITNTEHRDVIELLMPKQECKNMRLVSVLNKYGHNVPDNYQPGQNCDRDATVISQVLFQIGMVPSAAAEE